MTITSQTVTLPSGISHTLSPSKSYKKVEPPRCPECRGQAFEYDDIRDEISCLDCGLVLAGPPAYVAGIRKIDYPWQYTFSPEVSDNDGHSGIVFIRGYI